jgi:hypothetical protein
MHQRKASLTRQLKRDFGSRAVRAADDLSMRLAWQRRVDLANR